MAQKLITKEIKKFLKEHPRGSQDGLQGEAKVACRLFCPYNHEFTWFVLEGYEDNKDMAYGYVVHNNMPAEYSGYEEIDLLELKNEVEACMHCGGPVIERDKRIPVGMTLKEALKFTTDPVHRYL